MDDGVHPNAELGQHGQLTEPDQRVAGVVVQRGADEDHIAHASEDAAHRGHELDPQGLRRLTFRGKHGARVLRRAVAAASRVEVWPGCAPGSTRRGPAAAPASRLTRRDQQLPQVGRQRRATTPVVHDHDVAELGERLGDDHVPAAPAITGMPSGAAMSIPPVETPHPIARSGSSPVPDTGHSSASEGRRGGDAVPATRTIAWDQHASSRSWSDAASPKGRRRGGGDGGRRVRGRARVRRPTRKPNGVRLSITPCDGSRSKAESRDHGDGRGRPDQPRGRAHAGRSRHREA